MYPTMSLVGALVAESSNADARGHRTFLKGVLLALIRLRFLARRKFLDPAYEPRGGGVMSSSSPWSVVELLEESR